MQLAFQLRLGVLTQCVESAARSVSHFGKSAGYALPKNKDRFDAAVIIAIVVWPLGFFFLFADFWLVSYRSVKIRDADVTA